MIYEPSSRRADDRLCAQSFLFWRDHGPPLCGLPTTRDGLKPLSLGAVWQLLWRFGPPQHCPSSTPRFLHIMDNLSGSPEAAQVCECEDAVRAACLPRETSL